MSPEEQVLVGDRGEHRFPTPADSTLKISVFTFFDGKVSKQAVYFAPVMPAPEWRARWVVRDIGEY